MSDSTQAGAQSRESSSRAGKLTVGLLAHSISSFNLGVGAITQSQMAIVNRIAEAQGRTVHYVIVGTEGALFYPHGTLMSQITTKKTSLRSLAMDFMGTSREYRRLFSQCDFVIDAGEGDSFADIYGFRRLGSLALAKASVLRACSPLILSPQTIGPFSTQRGRALAKPLLARASAVFARDSLSFDYVRKIAPRAKVELSTDLAFLLPFQRVGLGPSAAVRVGINVSGLLMAGGYRSKNQFGLASPYPDLVHGLLGALVGRSDVQVHLIPHVVPDDPAYVDGDWTVSCRLREQYPEIILPDRFCSPVEAKSYVAAMDYFSGARMHACIAAVSAGVATMPIAYSRKATGLFSALGLSEVADARNTVASSLVEQVVGGLERRDQLREESIAAGKRAIELLQPYEECVTSLVKGLS